MNLPALSTRRLAAVLTCVLVLLPACTLEDPGNLSPDKIIDIQPESRFRRSPGTLKANGVDRLTIKAILKDDTPEGSDITFRTDAGTFAGVPPVTTSSNNPQELTVKAAGRQASVTLISSTQVVEATVSASVGDFTASTMILFIRVDPVRLTLESNTTRLMADGNDTATLTATLIPPQENGEESGTVSELTRIIFTAEIEGTNTTVETLRREAQSDAMGQATTTLVGRQKGLIRITATVDGLSDVKATVLLEFQ